MMMSGHGTSRNKVVQRERIEGSESTPRTLDGLIDCFCRRIDPVGIVASSSSILDIVLCLELFKALGVSIVDVLGVGDELRRRRTISGRHFNVEDRLMVQETMANTVVVSS